jgi:hypothetical protein
VYVTELGLCSHSQSLTVGGYLRQSWTDPRLVVDGLPSDTIIYQSKDMFTDIRTWIPDTFIIENTKGFLREPNTGSGRSFLRLHADGSILSSMQ